MAYVNWGSVTQKPVIWICKTDKKKWFAWIVWCRNFIWFFSTQLCFTQWSGFWCTTSVVHFLSERNTRNEILFKNSLWVIQRIILWYNGTTLSRTMPGYWGIAIILVYYKLHTDYLLKREFTWCWNKKLQSQGMILS